LSEQSPYNIIPHGDRKTTLVYETILSLESETEKRGHYAMSSQSKSIPADSCQSINVESKIFQIKLTGYQGNDIRIRWQDTGVRKVEISETDGRLDIRESDLVTIYGVLGLIELTRDKELTIEVPQTFAGDIIIHAMGGELVKLDHIQTSRLLDIQTKTRMTILNAVKAESIRIETKHSGGIHANNIGCEQDITLRTAMGAIICSISEPPKNYSVSCYSRRGRCNVPLTNSIGVKTLNAESVSGNISIQFMDAKG